MRSNKWTRHAVAAAVLGLMIASVAWAAPGDLDTSFGTSGIAGAAVNGSGEAVRLQPDGRIVVGGGALGGGIVLARFESNGSLDAGFGSGGSVLTQIGTGSYAKDVAIQPDGKLLAAGGTRSGSDKDFLLVRYNPDGSLDDGFGTGGSVVTPVGPENDSANVVVVQTDGKILLAGYSNTLGDQAPYGHMSLVRYLPDGTLDSSFGNDGKILTSIRGVYEEAHDLVIQPDGRILAGGYSSRADQSYDYLVVRYMPDGTLDTGFGTGGRVITAIGTGSSSVRGLALQPDGKVLATGYIDYGGGAAQFSVIRYLPNGSMDPSFGSGGLVFKGIGAQAVCTSIQLQRNGKIVLAGTADGQPTLARYLANGSRDTGFGTNGVTSYFAQVQRYASGVAVQGDGKILYTNGINSLFLARFNGDPNAAPSAVNDSYAADQATLLTVTGSGVLANDTDDDGDTLTTELVTSPAGSTLTLNANGSFSYQPRLGFTGTDSFSYRATDGGLNSNTATVSITVNAAPLSTPGAKVSGSGRVSVNGTPVQFNVRAAAGRKVTGNLSFADPDPARHIRSARITAVVVEGTHARVFGIAKLRNRQEVRFVADLDDLVTSGPGDTLALELANGQTVAASPVTGRIVVQD